MGMIYKRKYKDKKTGDVKEGKIYWIKYYRNGKPYRESTKSTKESDAKRLLRKREGEIAVGKLPGIYFDKIKFDELADDLIADYEINGKKTLTRIKQCISHLRKFFGGSKITSIDTPRIREYIKERLQWTCKDCGERFDTTTICPSCENIKIKPGAKPATINRELSALKRMLNLGARNTPPKVDRVPYVPMLKENSVRKGFFEHGDYLSLHDKLPEHLKGFASFGYKQGWRISEISNLTWKQVDRDQGIVRIEVGETKNNEARTAYLDTELKEVFRDQCARRKRYNILSPYVFTNEDGTNKVKDFRKAWNSACREIGLGYGYKISKAYVKKWEEKFNAGPTFHDFRRSSVRNMVRSGIPERVAMTISGHKTRSVFDRYNITNAADLKLAAQKLEEYLNSQTGTNTGTVTDFDKKRT